jgi:hypothetical protein
MSDESPKPTKMDTMMDESHAVTMRIGRSLLLESKKALADSGESQRHRTRDLLSLLVRANTAKDIAESQRLSDEDVIARESFFVLLYSELNENKQRFARSSSRDTTLRGNY